jgi:hypothetical protein
MCYNEIATFSTFILPIRLFKSYVLFFFPIQTFAGTLITRSLELKHEKRKSDQLLFQMLPPPVVRQLKQHRQVNHMRHEYSFFYHTLPIFFRGRKNALLDLRLSQWDITCDLLAACFLLIYYLAYSLILKMEVVHSSEMLVNFTRLNGITSGWIPTLPRI